MCHLKCHIMAQSAQLVSFLKTFLNFLAKTLAEGLKFKQNT